MPLYEVTYEDVGYGCDAGAQDELSAAQVAQIATDFLADRASRGKEGFPGSIRGIVGASMSVDDSVFEGGADEDGDVKAFVTVTVLVEAENSTAAEYIDAPGHLLSFVATRLDGSLSVEGNWEVTESTEHSKKTVPTP